MFQLATLLPSLIGGAMSLFGGMQQNSANKESSQAQMDFQRESNERQMAFQADQTGTQYQRGMADMKAAGLNPMLAYSQGGANSASGASSSGAGYIAQNIGEAALRGADSAASTARQVAMQRAQIENLEEDTRLKEASNKAAMASSVASLANASLASSNSATTNALRPYQVQNAQWDTLLKQANEANLRNTYSVNSQESTYVNSPIGRLMRQLGFAGEDAAKGLSSAKGLLNLIPRGR